MHFISSSYIAPEMHALDQRAKESGLVLLNEIGLDPRIDHLLVHDLVCCCRAFRVFGTKEEQHKLASRNCCSRLGETPNDFRYQFSWSPLRVLRALLSPLKSLRAGKERIIERLWHAIEDYVVECHAGEETFEVYPSRDSLPFLSDYCFDSKWRVTDFVHGTLRYHG
ncbi:MAG: hypothetical protein HRT36_02750 [Alphaproteobacteria bacterium]|nr:hypothetical protein [Alphaproteobacteria bacterium]